VRFSNECYQMLKVIDQRFPMLREAQRRGLALWVYGTILARSACQNAVITALLAEGKFETLRQLLREWLYDGKDRAAPCQTSLEIEACFRPLVCWFLSLWQGSELALALDPTLHGDRVVSLTISVLYRGSAIPLAWQIVPANRKGPWLEQILRLFDLLAEVLPKQLHVLILADRALWSPRLWARLKAHGFHPIIRLQNNATFQPVGRERQPAINLLPGPGSAWIGSGTAFRNRNEQQIGTIVVVWALGEEEPWVLLTDLPPDKVGAWWYSLRVWIELGFRALKSMGWQWQRTRRVEPARVRRHWLVLAVATLWVIASGTREEDAERLGLPPGRVHKAPEQVGAIFVRKVSVFARGLSSLQRQLRNGYLRRRLWLKPETWPQPPPDLLITFHPIAQSSA